MTFGLAVVDGTSCKLFEARRPFEEGFRALCRSRCDINSTTVAELRHVRPSPLRSIDIGKQEDQIDECWIVDVAKVGVEHRTRGRHLFLVRGE